MYKLLPKNELVAADPQMVQRLADNAFIPFDLANSDFQEYQRWLEAGNTPEPAETQE